MSHPFFLFFKRRKLLVLSLKALEAGVTCRQAVLENIFDVS